MVGSSFKGSSFKGSDAQEQSHKGKGKIVSKKTINKNFNILTKNTALITTVENHWSAINNFFRKINKLASK